MFSWTYSAIFWMLAIAWPLALNEKLGEPAAWALLAANVGLAAFVVWRCSSREIGLVGGMDVIAGSYMSGCANVTILYLPVMMVVVYLVAVFHSLASLARGRAYSQERWLAMVRSLHKNRVHAPLNPLADPLAPRPVDLRDPQDLIDGATRCEMAGEWAQAVVLFRMAGELLKGTPDATYVENCIKRIEEKRERVRGD